MSFNRAGGSNLDVLFPIKVYCWIKLCARVWGHVAGEVAGCGGIWQGSSLWHEWGHVVGEGNSVCNIRKFFR